MNGRNDDASEPVSSAFFMIDEELIAAAIWEIRESPLPIRGEALAGEMPARGRPTYFLLILIELMLPGISADGVVRVLQHFALSPFIAKLEKSRRPSLCETDRQPSEKSCGRCELLVDCHAAPAPLPAHSALISLLYSTRIRHQGISCFHRPPPSLL